MGTRAGRRRSCVAVLELASAYTHIVIYIYVCAGPGETWGGEPRLSIRYTPPPHARAWSQPETCSAADPRYGFQPGGRSGFPDGIPSDANATQTPATSTVKNASYLLIGLPIQPIHHQTQSYTITLQSPPSKSPPTRISPEFHPPPRIIMVKTRSRRPQPCRGGTLSQNLAFAV